MVILMSTAWRVCDAEGLIFLMHHAPRVGLQAKVSIRINADIQIQPCCRNGHHSQTTGCQGAGGLADSHMIVPQVRASILERMLCHSQVCARCLSWHVAVQHAAGIRHLTSLGSSLPRPFFFSRPNSSYISPSSSLARRRCREAVNSSSSSSCRHMPRFEIM